MDNVTHSLTGLALARAGLNRFCPRATILLVLSANAPDLDIIALREGALRYLQVHRGYSHSVVCLPLIAALPVLVVAAIYREKLLWLRAWLLCCAGLASHLLIDWTNSYGIRLFLPFSSSWFHLDVNGLYDACIMAVLVFAAVWPHFGRIVSREIGARTTSGRGIALAALTFFLLFDVGRAILHSQAIAQLNARIYEDTAPLQTAALPDAFNPFQWTGIVETPNAYRVMKVNTLGNLDEDAGVIFYKPARTPNIENAAATAAFRYFLYFARFPVWSKQPLILDQDHGARIDLTDLRFGTPNAGSFHCIAVEDSRAQILRSGFTYGSGSELGRSRRQ